MRVEITEMFVRVGVIWKKFSQKSPCRTPRREAIGCSVAKTVEDQASLPFTFPAIASVSFISWISFSCILWFKLILVLFVVELSFWSHKCRAEK